MSSRVSFKSSTYSLLNGSKLETARKKAGNKLSNYSFFDNISDDYFFDDSEYSPGGFEPETKRRTTLLDNARKSIGKGIDRGFAVLNADNRIVKKFEGKSEKTVLQDWYFKIIRIISKLMWRSWWSILVLLIFSQELVTSWSPIINFVNRGLYGSRNSFNQSQINIYSNVNPNSWNVYILKTIFQQNSGVNRTRKTHFQHCKLISTSSFPTNSQQVPNSKPPSLTRPLG